MEAYFNYGLKQLDYLETSERDRIDRDSRALRLYTDRM